MEKGNKWELIKDIVKRPATHEVRNSYGAWYYYRKFKCPYGQKISYQDFSAILKLMNTKLAEQLIETGDVVFPNEMGGLYVRVSERKLRLEDGKIKGLAVSWAQTISLWLSDEEARENKTLVREENRTLAKVHFRRARARFLHKSIYTLTVCRRIRVSIYNRIHEGHKYIFK